jgi:H+/Cl- antiporter ClcA
MAATLASVCSVPLTSVLLLFELTKDYRILLPLMVNMVKYLIRYLFLLQNLGIRFSLITLFKKLMCGPFSLLAMVCSN